MEPVNDPRLYSHRYEVTHLIARGGMAMVYRAQDTLLNRAVALKILYPELSATLRLWSDSAVRLKRPRISRTPISCRSSDWGEDEGTYFIVMELIDGTSLPRCSEASKTLTPAHSAQIVSQVAAALGLRTSQRCRAP